MTLEQLGLLVQIAFTNTVNEHEAENTRKYEENNSNYLIQL